MDWLTVFDEREQKLIRNCITYSRSATGGLPGHALMLIVARMVDLLEQAYGPMSVGPAVGADVD